MLQSRYETKVPLEHFQLTELRAAFASLGIIKKHTFPDRVVHSIYLDTPDFADYYDNVSGISRRSKTRLRWYNNETYRLFFEVKKKTEKVSTKTVVELENPGQKLPYDSFSARQLLSTNALKLRTHISPLQSPVLEVQYRRQYFELAPGIRATIDQDIRFRRLFPSRSQILCKSPVCIVLEFKYGIDQRRRFLNLIRGLPLRPFRHSKYVIGMDCTALG